MVIDSASFFVTLSLFRQQETSGLRGTFRPAYLSLRLNAQRVENSTLQIHRADNTLKKYQANFQKL